jgi:hypothetical protein
LSLKGQFLFSAKATRSSANQKGLNAHAVVRTAMRSSVGIQLANIVSLSAHMLERNRTGIELILRRRNAELQHKFKVFEKRGKTKCEFRREKIISS